MSDQAHSGEFVERCVCEHGIADHLTGRVVFYPSFSVLVGGRIEVRGSYEAVLGRCKACSCPTWGPSHSGSSDGEP